MSKVVLLGLDGATFDTLDPLMRENCLPHLARLVEAGVRGPLRSTIHPLTPAAWTSCMTGLNPGKHGIYDFRRRRSGSYELELVNARYRDGEALWAILSRQGKRVGVYNVPMTYPPEEVNGFMVSGMDTPGTDSSFTYPASLRTAVLSAVPGYHIDLDEATDDEDVFLARLQALAAAQQQALDLLIEPQSDIELVVAVLAAPERFAHTFWHDLDPAHPSSTGERARKARTVHERLWRNIDEMISRLWSWVGAEGTLIVVSDHGFGPLEKDVYMNRFLWDAGLLTFRAGQESAPFAKTVDWQRTKAYAFGFFGNINLNLRGREPMGCVEQGREAEDLKREIIAALMQLRDPENGQAVVDTVYRREELYSGPHLDLAPDLVVVMRNYAYMTRDGYEGMRHSLMDSPMSRHGRRLVHTGNHRLDGVFMMTGPGVRAGCEITGAQLIDIAPTVLYTLGLPVPGIMDGHVLRQVFTDDHLAEHPPHRLASVAPPSQSPAQRQIAALAHQVNALETRVKELEEKRVEAAVYARRLEQVIAEKNVHITELQDKLQRRDVLLKDYQRSIFFRAYKRWQQLTRRS